MKQGLHPKYEQTTISCACGAVYNVGSTKKSIKVEICANCHPVYTGQKRHEAAGGRIERFRRKYGQYVS